MAKTGKAKQRRTADPTALGREFKRKMQTGPTMLGGVVIEYLRPSLVKLYRHAGFDFIFVEAEHTLLNGRDFADFVQVARDNRLPVIAKIADLNRPEVIRALDCGVTGIQLPRTESRQDIETLYDYIKFPPKGTRPGAPCFGNVDYICPSDDRQWLKNANKASLLVAHIETQRGYENIEEIVTFPDLDMLYVGPYDFSISMGEPGNYDHPKVKRAISRILNICVKHKVAFGTTTSNAKAAAAYVKRGCRFFEMIDELTMVHGAACQVIDDYRYVLPQ